MIAENTCIAVIGAFDSKAEEYAYVIEQIKQHGLQVFTINIGTLGSTHLFPIDVEAEEIAQAGGSSLKDIRSAKDRGSAMEIMCNGASALIPELFRTKKLHAIFGMGGTGGTSVVTAAMRALPYGIPKVCLSTTAGGDVSSYVGTRDICMMPSVVDVAGLNVFSKRIFAQAAAAICGMAQCNFQADANEKPIVAASMFGNTTTCVDACRDSLMAKGFEVLVFHCTGTGGRCMEDLVADGQIDLLLDITTTEWADTLCGGVFDAGNTRLDAAGSAGIPHVIVPGCIDMVNFGGPETVPDTFRNQSERIFYEWNPSVTLMRTNADENYQLGKIFAEKANARQAPVAVLIPQRGLSILDSIDEHGDAQLFWDPEADAAFNRGLEEHIQHDIPVEYVDANINDPAFSSRAVELLLSLQETAAQV